MKLQSFRYTGPQAIRSMLNNGWMTVAAILTITITIFLCAVFWLILLNLDANATKVEDDIRILAYLDQGLDSRMDMDVYADIERQISFIGGVEKVEFVSRDEGLASLEDRFGGTDLLSTLGDSNPLPDMYSITAISSDYVAPIAQECAAISGVGVVRYGEGTVEKLFALTDTLRMVGLAVMGLLAVAAIVLIALSIRLTVMARKKEIMVMKWVGATDAFIRWPFILEGLLIGLIGAALAFGLVLLAYTRGVEYIAASVAFVQLLSLDQVWLEMLLFTLGAGLGLGAVGSILPLTRFLDV